MLRRPSVRLRLTLVYGGLFVAGGAVLLLLNYALVRNNLPSPAVQFSGVGPPGGSVPGLEPAPVDGIGDEASEEQAEVFRLRAERFRQQTLDQLVIQSGIALGVMAVASVGLGWLVAGRVLRPLKDITATARRLSEENLHERIGLAGPSDELKELADTFDAMLGRLEAAFDSQRRFIANASHELRTPLAIEQTMIEVALADPDASVDSLRALAEKVHRVSSRNQRLTESLLLLARSERAVEDPEPVDLAQAAAEALVQFQDGRRELGLRSESVLDHAPAYGNRALLEGMVANLVENAIRHNHRDGWIRVASSANERQVELEVSNSGGVLPAEAVESLFEPFRRFEGDRTRSDRGTGLGLSIVRAIAEAHGGEVEARALADGGLRVSVRLPRHDGT